MPIWNLKVAVGGDFCVYFYAAFSAFCWLQEGLIKPLPFDMGLDSSGNE